MPNLYKVVDLGTKRAGALDEFLRAGSMYFGDEVASIKPGDCLGYDYNGKYDREVRAKGYRFQGQDLTDRQVLDALPAADYYLAWDFLEHLPSVEHSDRILEVMLQRARVGVWLRMPSFEQDMETGEGRLRAHGLRFAWTDWHGHKSHYTLAMARDVITASGFGALKVKGNRLIETTGDRCVVPVSAPTDTVEYSAALGARPKVAFSPPLVGQWEVIVSRK
jgi:hypothetical protein